MLSANYLLRKELADGIQYFTLDFRHAWRVTQGEEEHRSQLLLLLGWVIIRSSWRGRTPEVQCAVS